MDFKSLPLRSMMMVLLFGILLFGLLFWKFFCQEVSPVLENNAVQNGLQSPETISQMASQAAGLIDDKEDDLIQEQLDRERAQQKQTKDLKIELEQTDLELEQEKALSQLNKLKKENTGAVNESSIDGQNGLPQIKVEYIGGGSVQKEAILSIGGTNYQVKEKSNPVGGIQVVSISDSSVTLHFSAPQDLTKTIEYRPE